MSVYGMFRDSVLNYPDKAALLFIGRSLSYRELDEMVGRFAGALKRLGVREGERVGAVMPNCPQQVIAFLAVTRIGAIFVPANVMYAGDELKHIFSDSGASLVITLDLFYENVRAVWQGKLIVSGIDDFLPPLKALLYRLKSRFDGSRVPVDYGKDILRFKSLLKGASPPPAEVAWDYDATMLILYTAGTTGKSKGVMLTHRNLVYNAVNQSENFDLNEHDVDLLLFPLFHIGGYMLALLCMFYVGGTTILEPRFDAGRYLMLIHRYRVTGLFAPPTVYTAFLNRPDLKRYDLSCMRISGASGAPVPLATQERWKELTGLHLLNGYGLTETSAGAIVCLPNKFNHEALGVPLGGEVKIVDDQGETVPIGERGQILFRGPQVAQGYWNMPEETAETFCDGWLKTGDIATMDDEGFLFFVDREKDLIIASAYNISPSEVEEVLLRHPAIKEVAVIGVPDGYRGETVKAFVVLNDSGSVSAEEIIRFGKENMAAYKYPRIVEFMDDLPKTMIMKVMRKKLREMEAERRQGEC